MTNFNLHVHDADPKTKVITKSNPYRLIIKNKIHYYERPVGSGIFYYGNGELVPKEKCPKLSEPTPLSEGERLVAEKKRLEKEKFEFEKAKRDFEAQKKIAARQKLEQEELERQKKLKVAEAEKLAKTELERQKKLAAQKNFNKQMEGPKNQSLS
jgi:hypothetical protein